MPAKHKGRSSCTEQQRQQIMETYDYLQELHREADAVLRQMGRSTYTDKLDVLLLRIADEIAGGLKFLVEISSSAQEQVPRVVFEVSVVCSNCTAPSAETRDNPESAVPLPDPAFLAYLDRLFNSANRSGRRLARGIRHKNSPGVVFAGHKKLMAVLTKERRHFRETAAMPSPAIEFRVNGPDCSVCHQPAKIDDPMKN